MKRALVYWCRTCGGGKNFGDQLGPILLARYGIVARWASAPHARLITVGSILSKIPNGWPGAVLGTGFIEAGIQRRFSAARIHAVRGDLTRKACGLASGTVLGDPGILVVDLAPKRPLTAKHEIVIPHYVDPEIASRHPDATRVRITSATPAFLEAVAEASLVYTSSLHALIAADALGVPQILEPHPRVRGGLFKFRDYVSAFGETIEPGVPHLTDRGAMAERQSQLRAAYRGLGS